MSPDEQPVQPEAAERDNNEYQPVVATGGWMPNKAEQAPAAAEPAPAPATEEPAVEEDEEEALPPSTVHPSAPAGTTADDKDLVAGRKQYGEFFIGMWYDHPNFGCPYCPYSTVEQGGNGLVELHTLAMIDSGDLPHRAALALKS